MNGLYHVIIIEQRFSHAHEFTIECFTAYNVNFPLKDLVL